MSAIMTDRLRDFLDAQHVPYHAIVHRRDYTAQAAAADTHTPGREFIKTILLAVDNGYALAVLPADQHADLAKVRRALGATDVSLASEEEMQQCFPDCEPGALPPFGHLYDLPVLMSRTLEEDEQITFNAGNHEVALRMQRRDFERLGEPRVVDLALTSE
jgi:Ala-tRNA(Pro) deacylase